MMVLLARIPERASLIYTEFIQLYVHEQSLEKVLQNCDSSARLSEGAILSLATRSIYAVLRLEYI